MMQQLDQHELPDADIAGYQISTQPIDRGPSGKVGSDRPIKPNQ